MKSYKITKHINRNIVLDIVRSRINQVGKIRVCDVLKLKKYGGISDDSFCEHFRVIMMGMVLNKKAKRICSGVYEITTPYDSNVSVPKKYTPTPQVIDFLKRELQPI